MLYKNKEQTDYVRLRQLRKPFPVRYRRRSPLHENPEVRRGDFRSEIEVEN